MEDIGEVQSELGKVGGVWRTWGRCIVSWGRWVECGECGGHGEVHSERGKVGGVWGKWRTWGRCRVSWGRWVECGECGGHGGGAELAGEGGWSVGSVEDMGEVQSELGKVGGVW